MLGWGVSSRRGGEVGVGAQFQEPSRRGTARRGGAGGQFQEGSWSSTAGGAGLRSPEPRSPSLPATGGDTLGRRRPLCPATAAYKGIASAQTDTCACGFLNMTA